MTGRRACELSARVGLGTDDAESSRPKEGMWARGQAHGMRVLADWGGEGRRLGVTTMRGMGDDGGGGIREPGREASIVMPTITLSSAL